jgi:hypothetical protein
VPDGLFEHPPRRLELLAEQVAPTAEQQAFDGGRRQALQAVEQLFEFAPVALAEMQVGQSQQGGEEIGALGQGGQPVEGGVGVVALPDGEDGELIADQAAAQAGIDAGEGAVGLGQLASFSPLPLGERGRG